LHKECPTSNSKNAHLTKDYAQINIKKLHGESIDDIPTKAVKHGKSTINFKIPNDDFSYGKPGDEHENIKKIISKLTR